MAGCPVTTGPEVRRSPPRVFRFHVLVGPIAPKSRRCIGLRRRSAATLRQRQSPAIDHLKEPRPTSRMPRRAALSVIPTVEDRRVRGARSRRRSARRQRCGSCRRLGNRSEPDPPVRKCRHRARARGPGPGRRCRQRERIVRNVLVVVVTFAFCAVVVTTATWVINRWERRRSTGSRPPDVRHRVDGGRGDFAACEPRRRRDLLRAAAHQPMRRDYLWLRDAPEPTRRPLT